MPVEVETQRSTHYLGKPLLQCKPSTSRRDTTSEKMEKLRPKICMKIISKVYYQIIHQVLDYYVCLYR